MRRGRRIGQMERDIGLLRAQLEMMASEWAFAAPVPPVLVAAASTASREGTAVHLRVDHGLFPPVSLIAVIDDSGGNPGRWWRSIREIAERGWHD